MGGIITGDVVDATDVLTPERAPTPAPAPEKKEEEKKEEEKKD